MFLSHNKIKRYNEFHMGKTREETNPPWHNTLGKVLGDFLEHQSSIPSESESETSDSECE